MTDVLLLTAVLRTDNLIYIARNIYKEFSRAEVIRPFWILCFDKFHADISSEKIAEISNYCDAHNIRYKIYYEGKEGETNYGGALMNGPLRDLKENVYPNDNPLVYVLDDDNIIHGGFIDFVEGSVANNECTWWLNMVDEVGSQHYVRYADRLAYLMGTGPNEGYRIIHPCASCDPSQVVIRLNKLLEIGGFSESRFYDFDFMNKIYANKNGLDESMRYQGTYPWIKNWEFYSSCYHNGLVRKESVDETIADLERKFSEYKEDSYIRIHIGNHMYVLPLTNAQVLEHLKKYREDVYDN